jgi:kumamolisin
MPRIVDISVDGTKNSPGSEADGEVILDIQIAAASYFTATGKPAEIRVYWANDIAPAVRAAIKDGCDVCSISWGMDEAGWRAHAAHDMEQAAIEAVNSGMIVFAAAGDNDSSDGGVSAANVDLPAGCPLLRNRLESIPGESIGRRNRRRLLNLLSDSSVASEGSQGIRSHGP